MCGICGEVQLRGDTAVDPAIVYSMNRLLEHRGPDGLGHFTSKRIAMAASRLSIVDLESGDQPFFSEDRSIVLVCNGEIFNFHQLKKELESKGHRLRSQCDVEVIVHLYEEHGIDCVRKLDGQFAFALYDSRVQRFFLVRDPFGICPLFYALTDHSLVFASEIKAILEHPKIERRVDLVGLDQLLSLPGLVSPRTMFEEINSLKPGHYLEVTDSSVRTFEYWDLIFPEKDHGTSLGDDEAIVAQLKGLIEGSILERLQSDVPLGVYISGGLDSSIIACFLARHARREVTHSFSIEFQEKYFDETGFQEILTKSLPYRHRSAKISATDIVQSLSRVIYHSECPLRESYNVASLALSEMAHSDNIKVVLSGEGSDELFGGYQSYRFDQLRSGSRAPSTGSASETDPYEAESRDRLWGDPNFGYEHVFSQLRDLKKNLYSDELRKEFESFEFLNFPLVNGERLRGRDVFNKRSYLDFKLRLCDHLVSDHGDRMTMANSVEGRYPFLDMELVEFAKNISPDAKLKGFNEKFVLKQAARELVPDRIIEREKFPFAAPGSPSLIQIESDFIDELLSESRIRSDGFFDPRRVGDLKRQYSDPKFDLVVPIETDLLMIVITFGAFLDEFNLPRLG